MKIKTTNIGINLSIDDFKKTLNDSEFPNLIISLADTQNMYVATDLTDKGDYQELDYLLLQKNYKIEYTKSLKKKMKELYKYFISIGWC